MSTYLSVSRFYSPIKPQIVVDLTDAAVELLGHGVLLDSFKEGCGFLIQFVELLGVAVLGHLARALDKLTAILGRLVVLQITGLAKQAANVVGDLESAREG